MGGAILAGALSSSDGASPVLSATQTAVVELDPAKRRSLKRSLGIVAFQDLREGAAWLEGIGGSKSVLLLAVKPQMLGEVAAAEGIAELTNRRLVISILAGVPAARIEAALPGSRCVRVMPNLPASIGLGTTAIAGESSGSATAADRAFAKKLFAAVGAPPVTVDESLLDAFTAVAGSGPAYLFLLAEAMEAAAKEVGLSPSISKAIVRSTLAGAAMMLEQSTDTAGSLRERVTSKKGTTAAALDVLAQREFTKAMSAAIHAARDRGRELAGLAAATNVK